MTTVSHIMSGMVLGEKIRDFLASITLEELTQEARNKFKETKGKK